MNMLIVLWDYNAIVESVQHVPTLNAQIEPQVMDCHAGERLPNTVIMNVPIMTALGGVRRVVQLM